MRTGLGRGSLYLAFSPLLFMASGYVIHVWLGQYLGPAEYGVYGVVIQVMTALNMIHYVGVPQAISKIIAQDEARADDVLFSGIVLQLGSTLVMSVAFFPGYAASLTAERPRAGAVPSYSRGRAGAVLGNDTLHDRVLQRTSQLRPAGFDELCPFGGEDGVCHRVGIRVSDIRSDPGLHRIPTDCFAVWSASPADDRSAVPVCPACSLLASPYRIQRAVHLAVERGPAVRQGPYAQRYGGGLLHREPEHRSNTLLRIHLACVCIAAGCVSQRESGYCGANWGSHLSLPPVRLAASLAQHCANLSHRLAAA